MTNFILIGLCMLAGMLFARLKTLPADAHRGINAWIIYIGLPAMSFKYLPYIHWSNDLWAPVLSPLVVWLGAWLAVIWYAKVAKLNNQTVGGLRLSLGLANTSFVGFPLIAAYFGEKYISVGIIADQVTFFILSTAGVVVAINASGKHTLSAVIVIKRLLRFPPFLGCVCALVIPHFIDLSSLAPLFDKLGGTVAPLALFSIGLQLRFDGWRRELKTISVALIYKLLIAPALVLLVFFAAGLKGMTPKISAFEAAMPTLLTSAVVADEYNLNPKLSNLIIGVGILISFGTTAIWWLILR